MDDQVIRCPSCGSPARERSPEGWPVCGRCGSRLARRRPAGLLPSLVAAVLLALVLFTWLGA